MRKLVSIKDCGGKTVDPDMPPERFSGDLVIHFTDGTSALMYAAVEACCEEEDAWIEELLVESIEKATDAQLEILYIKDVITCEERTAESARRLKENAAAKAEERRKQYEALKAEFEVKQ